MCKNEAVQDNPLLQYRRYRAPAEHGVTFLDPPEAEAVAGVAENRRRQQHGSATLGDQPLAEVAAAARRELWQLARDYTRQYRDLPPDVPPGGPTPPQSTVAAAAQSDAPDERAGMTPLVMAGHQPQLFHPGVWYKNFVLDRLARQVGGVGINWLVDNDVCGAPSIRVPAGSVAEPRVEAVLYDQPGGEIPYEERTLRDRAYFARFADRVLERLTPLVPDPLLARWWPRAVTAADDEPNLGRCLSRARHQQEGEWGTQTLELPLSRSCQTTSFRSFVLHLFHDLTRLREIYNDAVREYRRVHRIRSRSHPVPELEQQDGWQEAPLWVWTAADPRRRRLFLRTGRDRLELTDRARGTWALPRGRDAAHEALAEWEQRGIKLRPRALVTTMYARTVLCDLFVHGIGGGKYDQLTDLILHRWLHLPPPRFLVATATAQLPIDRPQGAAEELRRTERLLRELTFNPDRHVAPEGTARELINAKQQWLAADAPAVSGRERHAAMTRIRAELQPFVASHRVELERERDRLREQVRKERLLGSREFAFCLFPERTLLALLLDNA